jgi:HEAT repeat protein
MRQRFLALLLSLCSGLLIGTFPSPVRGDFDELIDSPMYHSPDLPVPPSKLVFPEEAKALWLRALERPDAETRFKAAEAIDLAHGRGVKGMETTIPALIAELDREDQHPTVRLAVAKALSTLEARDAAASFLRLAQTGEMDLREIVEPALARWDHRPARELWLKRLRDSATARRTLVLAIQSLAKVGEEQAFDRLREMLLSDRADSGVRLECARALASLRTEDLEPDAERLAGDASPRAIVLRAAAVALLSRHKADKAVELLQRLVKDPEPAVAVGAAARLLELDVKLLLPLLDHLLASPDPKLRSRAIDCLRRQPSEKHMRLLSDLFADVHPDVRRLARKSLYELSAKAEFRSQIIELASKVLADRSWQGQEQAAILLTQLDHKPSTARFLKLLTAERPEVFVSAAWGLRKLAVAETLPEVLKYVEDEHARIMGSKPLPGREKVPIEIFDHQLSQLNQFLGGQKYALSDKEMQKFVPLNGPKPLPEARAAAIWTLGLLHEGEGNVAFAQTLVGNLNHISLPPPPEDIRVRVMCAITLGRLGAKDSVSSLRTFYKGAGLSADPVSNACGWALERITGEAMPAPKPIEKRYLDWFLVPNP